MEKYLIGDVVVTWKEHNFPLKQDDFMRQFLINEKDCEKFQEEIVYESSLVNLEKYRSETLLVKNGLYELYESSRGRIIIYHWATCRFAFGFELESLKEGNKIFCYFNPEMYREMPLDAVRFFSCAGLHSKLLQKGRVVFHSAFIDWKGKGILFAGPSGVGKSTQAKLWEKYAGAEIINGDRALLNHTENGWKVYGYPCCGSSKVCINRTLPLFMIVLLEQGDENEIQMLSQGQKFRTLLSGSEVYLWSSDEINTVARISENIIKNVPIIKMICRPNENAVRLLEKMIKGRKENEFI